MRTMMCGRLSRGVRARRTALLCAAALAGSFLTLPGRAAEAPQLRIEAGGHTGAVHEVVFTPDGRQVVSVGQDKAVRIWDIASGRQVKTLRSLIGEGQVGEIYSAALSGNLLATGGSDVAVVSTAAGQYTGRGQVFAVRLFDIFHGRVRGLLPGHKESIISMAFSPDGTRLASSGFEGGVRMWNPEDRQALGTLPGTTAAVLGVAFSPDGKQVAGACMDGKVRVWDVDAKSLRRTLNAGTGAVRSVAWSSDGVLAAGGEDRRIRLWARAEGEPKTMTQPDTVTCLAFSADGRSLLSGSGETESAKDTTARVWSVADGRERRAFTKHASTILSVAFSPDGRLAVSADAAGVIYLWDPDSGREETRLAGTGTSLFSVAWSPDGHRVAWGRTPDGKLSESFDLYNNRIGSAAGNWQGPQTSAGGKTLAIAPDRASVSIRDAGGKEIGRIAGQDWEQAYAAVFTPQGQVAVGTNRDLSLYDVSGAPKRLVRFVGHSGLILGLAASGKYLASVSSDQTLRIWNLTDKGRDAGIVKNAVEPLVSLFAGRDGEWVAWNERTGYYAASPGGDDLIGWQVSRGPEQTAEFHKAFQFRSRFYQPTIVSRLLEAGSVEQARKVAGPLPTAPAPGVSLADQVARLPRIEIVGVEGAEQGADGYRAREAVVKVRVRVAGADPGGVTVKLNVNRPGWEKRLQEVPAAARPDERLLEARLHPGENQVRVVARNEAGETPPETVTVVYDPPSRSADPNLYVLTVGVSEYADPEIEQQSPLYFAANDATQIAAFYKGQQGKIAGKVIVKTLTNREATRQAIETALADISKAAQAGDRVIVFLSGHGFYIEDDFYFAPHDAKVKSLAGTGLDARRLVSTLSAMPCDDVVLLLDHCYAGGINLKVVDSERTRGRDVRNEEGRRLREANLFTLTASMPDQPSYEHSSWKHGAFTYALLEALNGKGGKGDIVALTGARDYLLDRVPALVTAAGFGAQTPKLFYPPTIDDLVPRSLPLARLR